MSEYIYMICYEGQIESSYTWTEPDRCYAEATMKRLQEQCPDLEWYIIEKDVS